MIEFTRRLLKKERNGIFTVSFFVLFGVLSGLIFSCKKPEKTNPEILPSGELLNAKSNYNQRIFLKTFRQDSVQSDETSVNLCGSVRDEVFGTTTAGFYTQLQLTGINQDFGINPHCDSIVVNLVYYGYYGDTNTVMQFNVRKLSEDISKDKEYFSNQTFYAGDAVGTFRSSPRPNDSISISGVLSAPALRFKLDNLFGQQLISAPVSNFSSDEYFVPFIKGFYIYADEVYDNNSGSILYLDLRHPQSKITVYYNSTYTYDFAFTSNNARINHFKHNYKGTEIEKQLDGTATDTSHIYVHGAAGTGIELSFPDLKQLADSGRLLINKAELVFTASTDIPSLFPPPPKILLARIGDSGEALITNDQLSGSSYFGGTYNGSSRTYSFNIAKYVQEVVDGKYEDHGLRILPNASAISPGRIKLDGGNGSTSPVKLKIVYTTY